MFGDKSNSVDALLRLYAVTIDFNRTDKSNNSVVASQYINFKDPDKKLSFKIQAEYNHYYTNTNNPLVSKSIIENR